MWADILDVSGDSVTRKSVYSISLTSSSAWHTSKFAKIICRGSQFNRIGRWLWEECGPHRSLQGRRAQGHLEWAASSAADPGSLQWYPWRTLENKTNVWMKCSARINQWLIKANGIVNRCLCLLYEMLHVESHIVPWYTYYVLYTFVSIQVVRAFWHKDCIRPDASTHPQWFVDHS